MATNPMRIILSLMIVCMVEHVRAQESAVQNAATCSAQADAKGLSGNERIVFRAKCKAAGMPTAASVSGNSSTFPKEDADQRSATCTAQADAKGLSGEQRVAFRTQCKATVALPDFSSSVAPDAQSQKPVRQPAITVRVPNKSSHETEDCRRKFKLAQEAGTLGSKTWAEFRKVQCSPTTNAAARASQTTAAVEDVPQSSHSPASIKITRPIQPFYILQPARLELNGILVATLFNGDSYNQVLQPGPVVVTVRSGPVEQGWQSYRFTAEMGQTYRLVVLPARENANWLKYFKAEEGSGPFKIAVEQP